MLSMYLYENPMAQTVFMIFVCCVCYRSLFGPKDKKKSED